MYIGLKTDVDLWSLVLFSPEYKRSRQEIKRKSLDTIKLQKKARKGEKNFHHWQDLVE